MTVFWGLGLLQGVNHGPLLLAILTETTGASHHSGAIALLFLLMVTIFATGAMRRNLGQVTPTALFLSGMVIALAIAAA